MKTIKTILILGLILMLSSCETKEQKISKAKEVVQTFMTNVSFDNYDVMFKLQKFAKKMSLDSIKLLIQ